MCKLYQHQFRRSIPCRWQEGWLQHCGDIQQGCQAQRAGGGLETGVQIQTAESQVGQGEPVTILFDNFTN